MKTAVLLAVMIFAVACKHERIAECDALVKTGEKIEKCPKIPADKRADITDGIKKMRGALQMLDDVGGADQAPKEQVDMLRRTCKQQDDNIIELYKKVAPECLE